MRLNKQLMTTVSFAIVAGMLLVPVDGDAQGRGYGRGAGQGQGGDMSTMAASLPKQALSAEEEIGLSKMREEEKLARDVYQVLYEKWKQPVFANIAQSEQRHMDSVKVLIDKYSIVDPIRDSSRGVFTDPELQELYNSLVEQGSQSLLEALQVGATIEDLDIKDLYDFLARTDNRDIKIVYQNLAKGSRNHLRSFTSQLSFRGINYDAQFLTAAQVSVILTSPMERGRVDENGNSDRKRGRGRGPHA